MRDRLFIVSGLAIFLALVTVPFWYRASAALDLKRPQGQKCVADIAFMRRSHMEMLNRWRDEKVRAGLRPDFTLTRTCLAQCHGAQAEFCGRCHAYVGLDGPYCWDCHQGATL